MATEKKKTTFLKDMFAGAAAGCLEVTIMYPTEYVKTQLQLQSKTDKLYSGMIDCAVRLGCFVRLKLAWVCTGGAPCAPVLFLLTTVYLNHHVPGLALDPYDWFCVSRSSAQWFIVCNNFSSY